MKKKEILNHLVNIILSLIVMFATLLLYHAHGTGATLGYIAFIVCIYFCTIMDKLKELNVTIKP